MLVKWVVPLSLTLLLVGCNSNVSGANTTQTKTTTQPTTTTTSASSTPTPTYFKVGDGADNGLLSVTLNSVRLSKGDDLNHPQYGQYVIVNMTVQNIGKSEQPLSSMMQLALQDDKNYSYGVSVTTLTQGSLNGTLQPGQTVRGEEAFDVPTSKYYLLSFDFGNGKGIWKFNSPS